MKNMLTRPTVPMRYSISGLAMALARPKPATAMPVARPLLSANKELNKAVIRIDTTYTDGTAETKYYKIKTYNNNTFTHYTFYEVEFD